LFSGRWRKKSATPGRNIDAPGERSRRRLPLTKRLARGADDRGKKEAGNDERVDGGWRASRNALPDGETVKRKRRQRRRKLTLRDASSRTGL
jgi:hypothetical protein